MRDTSRFTKTSKRDYALAFSTCAVLVNSWALFNLAETVPSWILQLTVWEILGGISYVLTFALIESLVIFTIIVLINFLLPKRFFSDKFFLNSTLLALVLLVAAILLQNYFEEIITWNPGVILGVSLFAVLLIVILFVLVNRVNKLNVRVYTVVDRAVVLGTIYIFFDILGLFNVITRNL